MRWRFLLASLWFLAFFLHDFHRNSLSITIVCMVNSDLEQVVNTTASLTYDTSPDKHTLNLSHSELYEKTCYSSEEILEDENTVGEFSWRKPVQGLLLGAVFWGYMVSQFPSGWLSERFGAHRVILAFYLAVTIGCLFTPMAARCHPYVLLVVRVAVGMGLAVLFPSLPVFWSRWAPPDEWNRLLGVSLSGGLIGSALTFPFGGFMCKYGFAGGWPSLYYTLGCISLVWCVVWAAIVRDSPGDTRWMSKKERKYIEHSTASRAIKIRRPPIPWKEMMTSRATLALLATHTLINYGVYMLATQLPTYMKEVMKYDIDSNGFYTMLPYLLLFAVMVFTSFISDFLISRNILHCGTSRKLFNTLGSVLPGVCMLVLALVPCISKALAVALLCGAVGMGGFAFGGFVLNYSDIGLQFAGSLSGIGNTFSSMSGIVAPYIVSSMTVHQTRQEWQNAFLTAVGSFILAAVIFLGFASGDPQPWATQNTDSSVFQDHTEIILDDKSKISASGISTKGAED